MEHISRIDVPTYLINKALNTYTINLPTYSTKLFRKTYIIRTHDVFYRVFFNSSNELLGYEKLHLGFVSESSAHKNSYRSYFFLQKLLFLHKQSCFQFVVGSWWNNAFSSPTHRYTHLKIKLRACFSFLTSKLWPTVFRLP